MSKKEKWLLKITFFPARVPYFLLLVAFTVSWTVQQRMACTDDVHILDLTVVKYSPTHVYHLRISKCIDISINYLVC